MTIFWKLNGSLDINTDPTELPEQSANGSIISGALARCKNLSLDQPGVAKTRAGSTRLSAFTTSDIPELIRGVAGERYIFAGDDIYFNERQVAPTGFKCAAPVFLPVPGAYPTEQTVAISTTTPNAEIYYTLDGTTPGRNSARYSAPVRVPAYSMLSAITVGPGRNLSDSEVTSGFYITFAANNLITETLADFLIAERDSNNITQEGP